MIRVTEMSLQTQRTIQTQFNPENSFTNIPQNISLDIKGSRRVMLLTNLHPFIPIFFLIFRLTLFSSFGD
jgi:hypothetical protein